MPHTVVIGGAMTTRDDDDDDKMALQRAIGRLEGRFDGLAARVLNLDTTTDRRLSSIADKLEVIKGTLAEMGVLKAAVMGGWFTISVIAIVISAVIGLGISVWGVFHH